jgi:DNA polymerase delta subunit 2
MGRDRFQISLHILAQFLTGKLGELLREEAKAIVRVVILGNLLYKPPDILSRGLLKTDQIDFEAKMHMSISLKDLDSVLAEIAKSVPIDILPGPIDPSN